MTDMPRFERRIAALVRLYADRAPTDVDPVAMTQLAAGGSAGLARWTPPLADVRRAAWLALAAALVSIVLGGLLLNTGSPPPLAVATPSPQPSQVLGAIGHLGLPPVGAVPSTPETGELVVEFHARSKGRTPSARGQLGAWLFADGRLIRHLEADTELEALVEQRLSPVGIDYLLHAVLATLPDPDGGTFATSSRWFFWGGYTVRSGPQLVDVSLDTGLGGPPIAGSETPAGQLTDTQEQAIWAIDDGLRRPEQWLPAGSWADGAARPFVASRYAACVIGDVDEHPPLDLLPTAAADFLSGRGVARDEMFGTCRTILTDDARALVQLLEAAGYVDYPLAGAASTLTYKTGPGMPARVNVMIDPILPDGRSCCRGG